MRRTESYWRWDWRNVGRSCHASYCIWMICVEPGFPGIQAGKYLWSTRWRCRQSIERRISWEAGTLESYWFVVYVTYVPVFHHTFLIWNLLVARGDIWLRFLHMWGSARGVHPLTYIVRRTTSMEFCIESVMYLSRRRTYENCFKIIADIR